MKSVIIGLGNPIVGDDAVGIKVVEYIRDTLSLPSYADVMADISIAGVGLVELFRGYKQVILIDSIQSGAFPIGTVKLLAPDQFSLALHTSDYHNMDLFTALEFSNQMYDDIPEEIKIIGIEIISPIEFSDELSTDISKKFEDIVDEVYKIITQELEMEINQTI